MNWFWTLTRVFFVRSKEQNSCPCCNGSLKVIGSRIRSCINGAGEKVLLVIRRLSCLQCSRIHHELPDILVPYKRHVRESIEVVVTGDSDLSVIAEESTLKRWKTWFLHMADYFHGCLESISIRDGREAVEVISALPGSKFQRSW